MLLIYMNLIGTEDEKDKFETLYLKYRKQMKYIAFKILQDEQLAEDAVHNAFIKIIDNLGKFSEIECQETVNLIVIIIRSAAIDIYRKRKKDFENTADTDFEPVTLTDFSVVETEPLVKAISELPSAYRDVLLLKIEYGYKDREIAEILGIKTHSVSKRLERARKKLLKEELF